MTTTTAAPAPQMSLFDVDTDTPTAELTRFVGRCKVCRTPQAAELEDHNLWRYGKSCCGRIVVLEAIHGTHNPNKPCDARCMAAVGPACSCSCGGANHSRWIIAR